VTREWRATRAFAKCAKWGSGYPTMASKYEGVGFLRVALRNFARTTRVSAEQVRREVALSNCPVTSWTVMSLGDVNKLSKDSFSEGELLELSVRERMPGDVLWKEEPEKLDQLLFGFFSRWACWPFS